MNPRGWRMPCWMIATVLAVASAAGGSAAAPHATDYRVCVTNEHAGTLSVLDGASRRIIATIPLGKRPRGIHASPDGRTLYVALSGSPIAGPPGARDSTPAAPADRSADGIGIVDVARGALVRVIPGGVDPEEFAVSTDGTRLFVANEDAATMSVVRIADGTIERSVPVGPEPEGVAVSPRGDLVLVTCETHGEVCAIDPRTGTRRATFRVGGRPRSAAFVADGSRVVVPSETTGELHELDVHSGRVVRTVRLPEGARPMKVVPGANAWWVSTGRGGSVCAVDRARFTVRTGIQVGPRPWGIALAPDGTLWVANGPSNDVSVVDVAAGREVARIPAGEGPWGVAIVPAPR